MTFCVEGGEALKESGIDPEDLFMLCAKKALSFTGCPYDCQADLTITDNEGIREVNRQFRGLDEPTDVLSFPMLEFEAPGKFDIPDSERAQYFDQETGELVLGSIMISLERAKQQAADFGHGLKREMAFLIVHSMLHLQGFDHISEGDRIVMEKAQEEILNDLNILRTCNEGGSS